MLTLAVALMRMINELPPELPTIMNIYPAKNYPLTPVIYSEAPVFVVCVKGNECHGGPIILRSMKYLILE